MLWALIFDFDFILFPWFSFDNKATSLLSLIPPSCMVVPRRELVNILNPSTSQPQSNQSSLSKHFSMEHEVIPLREWSPILSINSRQDMSVSSSMSSMDYVEHIEAQSRKLTWAKQVESREQLDSSQTNTSLEHIKNPVYIPHDNNSNNMNNTFLSPNLESSVILYQTNQPADPQLWDGYFTWISLFGIDEFLAGDIKNIACSLQRIATFIKQRLLDNRTAIDIP